MIIPNKKRLILSLRQKKNRNEKKLFLVEGSKSIIELLKSTFKIDYLLISDPFFKENKRLISDRKIDFDVVNKNQIEKLSVFDSNNSGIAVAYKKTNHQFQFDEKEIILALDEIKDPGNLGTIIRIADWYGIKKIVASLDTVDMYNSKVISSSMGSFIRVDVFYTDLSNFLKDINLPIIGSFLDGKSIYTESLPRNGILVIGNESRGIKKEIAKLINKKITIPKFGEAESLNAAVSTAVILDNWRRGNI